MGAAGPKGKKIVQGGPAMKAVARRRVIASLYLRGMTQVEIGYSEELKRANGGVSVSQTLVSLELSALKKAWLESSLVDFNEAKARELARIDQLENAAWTEWERSKGQLIQEMRRVECAPKATKEDEHSTNSKKKRVGNDPPGGNVVGVPVPMVTLREMNERRVQDRLGDPRYLDQVRWCVEQRLKILGAYKQEDKTAGGTVNQLFMNWDEMVTKPALIDPAEERIKQLEAGIDAVHDSDDARSGGDGTTG